MAGLVLSANDTQPYEIEEEKEMEAATLTAVASNDVDFTKVPVGRATSDDYENGSPSGATVVNDSFRALSGSSMRATSDV